jgi:hypothetical protein
MEQKKFRVTNVNWVKHEFDAEDAEDLAEYKYFLQHQRWKTSCPFILEWPFVDIIQMVEHKIVRQHINSIIKLQKKR